MCLLVTIISNPLTVVTHVLTLFLVTIIHPFTYVTHVLTLLLYVDLKILKDSYDED